MAGPTGLEPAPSGVTGRRYNQLNYGPMKTACHREGESLISGRRNRDRTCGLSLVRAALYRLSYPPASSDSLGQRPRSLRSLWRRPQRAIAPAPRPRPSPRRERRPPLTAPSHSERRLLRQSPPSPHPGAARSGPAWEDRPSAGPLRAGPPSDAPCAMPPVRWPPVRWPTGPRLTFSSSVRPPSDPCRP